MLRDALLLVLPSGAFAWEAMKDKPSPELLIVYMALLACPWIASVIFLARHSPGGIDPPSPPSLPPSQPVPPPSSSSSMQQGG
ncbi:hypothetical protein AB0C69_11060 [Actinomadura sp. NPDC048032]|uniref:hypothetical protein n=1 Tax=Actinomadura sp. NPDC048032 TaxID=3155747 RepID=UPI0033CEB56B